jgi:hypothetical protein
MRTLKAKGRHLDAACLQVLTASIDHYETRCALELAQHYFSLFVQTQKNSPARFLITRLWQKEENT